MRGENSCLSARANVILQSMVYLEEYWDWLWSMLGWLATSLFKNVSLHFGKYSKTTHRLICFLKTGIYHCHVKLTCVCRVVWMNACGREWLCLNFFSLCVGVWVCAREGCFHRYIIKLLNCWVDTRITTQDNINQLINCVHHLFGKRTFPGSEQNTQLV